MIILGVRGQRDLGSGFSMDLVGVYKSRRTTKVLQIDVQYLLDLFFAVEIGRNVSGGGENVLNHTVMYVAVIIPCCRVLVEALFVCLTQ